WVKLRRLDQDNLRRDEIAGLYNSGIDNPLIIKPYKPVVAADSARLSHVWHLYVIRSTNRDLLQQHLAANDIQTVIHYPIAPHRQKAYSELNNLAFPITELIHNQVLSLPISPVMTDQEADRVIKAVNSFKI